MPSVLATSSAAGIPNITYVSKVLLVDDERVAVSNQFLSKSARNIAENPHVSMLIVDGPTHDEYRLTLVYERTERRGPIFDQLAAEVDLIATTPRGWARRCPSARASSAWRRPGAHR